MSKQAFLKILQDRLTGLPKEDIDRSVEFYSEMIEDRIEDGMSEEEAVNSLGSIDGIVNQILSETPIVRLVKEKVKPKRELSALEIILIIIGAPIWAPLLVSAVGTLFSLYMSIWGIIIALYAVVFTFAASSISLFLASISHFGVGNIAGGVFLVGTALVCAGVSILLFIASNWIAKGILILTKKVWIKLKSFFVGGR